jgi:hypothetical protein
MTNTIIYYSIFLDLILLFFSPHNNVTLNLVIIYLLLFVIVLIKNMKINENLLITYFVLFFCVFYWGRLVGEIAGTLSLGEMNSFIYFSFSSDTQILALLYTKISLTVFLFTYSRNRITFKIPLHDAMLFRIGLIFFTVAAPLATIKYLVEFSYALKYGLLSFYTGQLRDVTNLPAVVTLSHNLLNVGYFTILASFPREKMFDRVSLVFIIISIFSGIQGVRSLIILPVLFYMWYKNRYYEKNLFKVQYVVALVVLFVGFQFLGAIRFNNDVKLSLLGPIISQGGSIKVVNLAIEKKDQLKASGFNNYIFSPITFPLKYFKHGSNMIGQTEKSVFIRGDLNHALTYLTNRNYYLRGGGLGSAYVAEAIEYGLFGLLVFTALLSIFVKYFLINSHKPLNMYFSYLIVTHIIIIARTSYFINFWTVIKYLAGYLLVIIIQGIMKLIKVR